MISKKPKVCFFGIYDPEYARNAILMEGFRRNGFEVYECRISRNIPKFKKWVALYKEYRKMSSKDFDIVLVAYPAQVVAPLARLLFGKKVVVDLFVSLFDTNVSDRKRWSVFSMRGALDFCYDFIACRVAWRAITDTNLNIEYFHKHFFINKNKCIYVPVGADIRYLHKTSYVSEKADEFSVHFHGNYIPLQGVQYIVKAAKLLENENIFFTLIGGGQTYKEIVTLTESINVKNVCFKEYMHIKKLNDILNGADVVLGIFGDTKKARRVVPNKVYEGMAVGASIVTADTEAVRQTFGCDFAKCFTLVPPADPDALADAIRFLKKNPKLSQSRAENAYLYFQDNFLPEKIVEKLLNDLNVTAYEK